MDHTTRTKKDISFKDMIKGDWPICLIIAGSLIVGLFLYPRLPNSVPIHWGANGKANGFASRTFAVLFEPLLNTALYFVLIGAPFIDPERKNFANFLGAYRMFRLFFHSFLSAIYIVSLLIGLGYRFDMAMAVNMGLGFMFIVIGLLMGSFRHNYTIGIRVPWTLASPLVWDKTHKFAGSIWIGAGIVTVLGAFAGSPAGLIIMLISLGIASIIPVIYSYLSYRKLMENKDAVR